MKSLILLKVILFAILVLFHYSANAQDKKLKSFKDFIQLLEKSQKNKKIKITDSVYNQFLNEAPFKDDESEKKFKILLIRTGYVGILHINLFDMGKSEESQLITYNWNGEIVSEIDYSAGTNSDYFSESLTCKLKSGDKLECRQSTNEEGSDEINDEENKSDDKEEVIIIKYVILKDGTIKEIESTEVQD